MHCQSFLVLYNSTLLHKYAPVDHSLHLNFDDAWDGTALPFATRDLRDWGPRLRYSTRQIEIDLFDSEVARQLPPFLLYGSGDFHHLSGVFVRRIAEPVTIVSFDNHPDWDIRPPRWSCGAWVNRALELPQVQRVCVWGCGNFELTFPTRLFGNHAAIRRGRLEVYPWEERFSLPIRRRFPSVNRKTWRERFEKFALQLAGQNLYVTVDLDCLRSQEAVTNWEAGLFTAADVAWAIEQLHTHAQILAGDICGAGSRPVYSRPMQRFAGWMDHPRVVVPMVEHGRRINMAAFQTIWPALAKDTLQPWR